ncbi:MAG: OmpH family outer membrane protein, partial [Bacteroidetes bacterium]|nr:OmpH family outer membrane protein [Bacteroidota bacterium]
EPIVSKAKKAIQDVAKEQGLTYVFDVAEAAGGVVILYYSEDSMDILALVKKKMGIQ